MVSLTDFRNLGKYFMTSLTYLVSVHFFFFLETFGKCTYIQPFCKLLP